MSTSPDQGITVYTTTGNTYQVAAGVEPDATIVATGELCVTVYGDKPADGSEPPWLGSFGNVEAVYKNGAVVPVPVSAVRGI